MDQRRDDPVHDRGGNCKANTCIAPDWGLDGEVHANDIAVQIQQRATRVARVDGCVGLDDIGQGVAVARQIAPTGKLRPSALTMPVVIVPSKPKGLPMAMTCGPRSDAGISKCQGVPFESFGRRDLDDCQVGLRVGGDDFGICPDAVIENHHELGRGIHHMIVGDDVTVIVVDEAGALALLWLLLHVGRHFEAGNFGHFHCRAHAFDLNVDNRWRHSLIERRQRLLIFVQGGIDLGHGGSHFDRGRFCCHRRLAARAVVHRGRPTPMWPRWRPQQDLRSG